MKVCWTFVFIAVHQRRTASYSYLLTAFCVTCSAFIVSVLHYLFNFKLFLVISVAFVSIVCYAVAFICTLFVSRTTFCVSFCHCSLLLQFFCPPLGQRVNVALERANKRVSWQSFSGFKTFASWFGMRAFIIWAWYEALYVSTEIKNSLTITE